MHRFLPLIVFLLLVSAFSAMLWRGKGNYHTTAMIDKAVPAISLPAALPTVEGFSEADFRGTGAIVNVFASWCLSCVAEHAVLTRMARETGLPVFGINYKDKPDLLAAWLEKNGNPYDRIGADPAGRAAIEWGVYGVPETFLVDASGRIRYKHAGPVSEDDYKMTLLPLIAEMKR